MEWEGRFYSKDPAAIQISLWVSYLRFTGVFLAFHFLERGRRRGEEEIEMTGVKFLTLHIPKCRRYNVALEDENIYRELLIGDQDDFRVLDSLQWMSS